MRKINLLITLFLLLTSCNDDDGLNTFKGKLVKKGICMNYVIEVKDSDFPQEILEKKWTDGSSEKKYEKVFRLHSICDFPDNIKENDSFDFIIDNEKKDQMCAICYAYTPTPEKSVSITVLD